jgi:hypothetical protein
LYRLKTTEPVGVPNEPVTVAVTPVDEHDEVALTATCGVAVAMVNGSGEPVTAG